MPEEFVPNGYLPLIREVFRRAEARDVDAHKKAHEDGRAEYQRQSAERQQRDEEKRRARLDKAHRAARSNLPSSGSGRSVQQKKGTIAHKVKLEAPYSPAINDSQFWKDLANEIRQECYAGTLEGIVLTDGGQKYRIPRYIWGADCYSEIIKLGRVAYAVGGVTIAGRVMFADTEQKEPGRTGAPGRPSNMHFIDVEFATREKCDGLECTLAEQARTLLSWFEVAHSGLKAPTAKTIENRLRERFRKVRKTP